MHGRIVLDGWFTHRRGRQFHKSQAPSKRRCGQVTPGVLAYDERLLRQLRGALGINGQCTVTNLKRGLMDQGLCSSGPKAKLVQRIYNYIGIIRTAKGLPLDDADVTHVEEVLQNDVDSDESYIVCAKCLSDETTKDKDILICDGEHIATVGYHQKCCVPVVLGIPNHSWFCPHCASHSFDANSRMQDAD